MTWSKTPGFRTLCRFVLFFFLFSLFHPANLGIQRTLAFQARTADAGHWLLDFWRWILAFSPTPAYAQDALLASTPDANTSDPFIVQKAAELGHDPQRIFAFVRDEIGYESYKGSLRGARGTLWSKAGNALDQASLLVALLRAAGVPSRYIQGTLSDALAKDLILSMFPPVLRVVGCPPADAQRADPANDPRLLAETREHYWVEFNDGSGFKAVDPTFKGAAIGQTFTAVQSTFAEVSDKLRHKVTVRLKAEISGSFPNVSPEIKTPLNETFNTVELVGKPLSIGHFVDSFSPSALLFGYTTHTYSPYILIGQSDSDISDDPIIRGEDYQEFLSNFPLSSQFLTGIFLEIDVINPGGAVDTFERTLVDRIGFAVRENGGTATLGNLSAEGPVLSELDIATVNVLPGLQSLDAIAVQQDRMVTLRQELVAMQPLVAGLPPVGPLTEEQRSLVAEALRLARESAIATTEIVTMAFAGASDKFLSQLEQGYLTKAYYSSPRLLLTLTRKEGNNMSIKIDLRKNDLRAVSAPGQVDSQILFFEFTRGLMESTLEGEILSRVTGQQAISVADIFGNLKDDDTLVLLSEKNLRILETTTLSETAKARISEAVKAGQAVLTPTRMVTIGGTTTVGWFETNFHTGQTISMMEDGGHQSLVDVLETYNALLRSPVNIISAAFIGTLVGFAQGTILFLGEFLANLSTGRPFVENVTRSKAKVANNILSTWFKKTLNLGGSAITGFTAFPSQDIVELGAKGANCFYVQPAINIIENDPSTIQQIQTCALRLFALTIKQGRPDLPYISQVDEAFFAGMLAGQTIALGWIKRNFPADPLVFPFLSSDLTPGPASLPPSTEPSVSIQIVQDAFFTMSFNGAELPFVFKAQIQNLGPAEDTFELTFPDTPAGSRIQSSVPRITIPPGATGEVGLCIQPVSQIDPVGTPTSFSVSAISATHPAISATNTKSFTTPEIQGVTLITNPAVLSSTPGTPVSTTLTLRSVGNVPANILLDFSASSRLTVSGINNSVTLGVGESANQTLTLTPVANAALNSNLTATITATFGPPSAPQTATAQVAVQVVSANAQSVMEAAIAATEGGRPGLGSTLNALAAALTNLSQDPANNSFQSRAVAILASLIDQLNAPVLIPFAADLAAAKDAIASGTPANVQSALHNLSGIMANLGNALSSPAAFPFEAALQPNSAAALPQTPTHFALALQNTGEQTTTYNLTLSPLPPGVTGELNRTSVTLAPGEAIPRDGGPNVEVTLTPSAQELLAFDFAVTVSVAGSPNITRTVQGAFTVRNELVDVVAVEASPAFTDPGGQVNISTRLLNAVNQTRQAQVSYTVKNPAGTVVFTSAPQEVELTVLSSLSTIDLGALNTTGFALGDHTITVTVADLNGQPIPGATGQGSLLIGSPLAASMAVAPQTLPPGNGTVTTTLQLDSHLDFPAPQIELLGLVDTAAVATSVAVNGNLVYVCGTEDITIVDISDRRNPRIVSTFADDLITNANSSLCRIMDGHLVVMWQEQLTVVRLPILVFNLENPTQPALVSNTSVDRRFLSSLFIQGNTAFATTTGFIFNALLKTVSFQFGDFLSFDLSNLASPRLADVLINTDGAPNGGRSPVWQGVPINAQLALVAASTSTLFRTDEGVGRVLVVDIADPNNLAVVRELQIPGTVHIVGVGIQGNLALAVGKTRGIRNPGIPDFDILGDLMLISLDLTDPRAPRVLGTLTAAPDSPGGGQVAPLGNGFFAVSGATISGQSVLMVVNANDPQNLTFTTLPVPERLRESAVVGNTLLTTSAAGLGVYNIGSLFGTRVTARVQVPKNTGVNLIPASLTIAPTDMITGSDFDTLVWERLLSAAHPGETISWQSTVTALQPGEAREVALGATIDFTVPSGDSGQIKLPPLFVVSEQILALQPASRTARPGEATTFTLTVQNPTASAVTYALSVQGVPQSWVNLTPSANVPAQGQTALTLTLQSDPLASVGENGFVVTAQANTGAIGAVHGTLLLAGAPVGGGSGDIGQDVASAARGVVLGLTPDQATAGQGTSATYAVRVTNTGNVTDSYTLSATLPAGLNGSFGQQVVEVPPGLDNFRDVPFTVTPAPGTAVGNQSFAVTAVSIASASVRAQVTGTIVVSNNGVQVAFTTPSGVPGSTFSVRVTNTGQIQDTFGLALGGPLAPFATLSTPTTSLAPGASQIVTVTLPAVHFAFPGTLDLAVVATSQGNTAVQNRAMADVAVTATQSVTATFAPEAMELPAPGPATFLLLVDNTGNTEDAYTAAITGLTGPITARLTGLDGQPAQTLPVFRLPGLATGAILLNANMLAPGVGTVTVSVTSLNQAGVQASDMVTLRTAFANQAPVANAGPDQTVPFGKTVQLNGNASTDPDHGPAPLQFAWHFGQKPAGSQLTDGDLHGAATALASFMPDVRGDFVLTLSVSDGAQTVTDDVRITVLNNHPVAIAGPDRNVKTGQPVRLDGSNSFDPDGDLIAYAWSLQAKAAKSKLTDAAIKDRTLPNPSVIPDIAGEYIFRLVVDDGQEDSPPDFVVLTAHKKNVPPNADAGDDQNALVGDMVLLDGRASDDPDNGPGALTFLWTFASKPPASHLQARDIADATHAQAHFVPDAPGTYVLRLLVSDSCKRDDDDKKHDRHDDHGRDRHDDGKECDDDDKEHGNDTDEVVITVSAPNVPPNARAGADQTLPLHQAVPLDGSASEDPDNGPAALSFTWHFVSVAEGSSLTNADIDDAHTAMPHFTPDVIGSYVMRLQVSDGAASDFDNVLVTVLPPNKPPVCAQAKAQPARLWPPNHKLVPVTIEGITDPDQHPVTLTVTQVRQDEPVNSHGDGDTSPDAVLQGRTILLRAERAGSGNGRVYHVTFTAQDNFGGSCVGTVTVCVPHSQQDMACGDDGLQYDATKP